MKSEMSVNEHMNTVNNSAADSHIFLLSGKSA